MQRPELLITGANGEVGHALIHYLHRQGRYRVVALDLNPLAPHIAEHVDQFYQGSITDPTLLETLREQHCFSKIFHLAAILSSGGERNPSLAHEVNVNGSVHMLNLAHEHTRTSGSPCMFLFPSTIAAHGFREPSQKAPAGAVKEDEYLLPITIYGVNKLYIENLGRYYSETYNLLSEEGDTPKIDFRCVRYPGLISADSVPSGGTSDYGPEMLHAAAKGEPYESFVGEEARLPFMVMPDAIDALVGLSEAKREDLSRHVYNVTAFSVTAAEIRDQVLRLFPRAEIRFGKGGPRQMIVDSWPGDIDDSAARNDWGWKPKYELDAAFSEYLAPRITKRYQG